MASLLKSFNPVFLSLILIALSRVVNAQAIDTVNAGKVLLNAALTRAQQVYDAD